jgi:hypothetical protein
MDSALAAAAILALASSSEFMTQAITDANRTHKTRPDPERLTKAQKKRERKNRTRARLAAMKQDNGGARTDG